MVGLPLAMAITSSRAQGRPLASRPAHITSRSTPTFSRSGGRVNAAISFCARVVIRDWLRPFCEGAQLRRSSRAVDLARCQVAQEADRPKHEREEQHQSHDPGADALLAAVEVSPA